MAIKHIAKQYEYIGLSTDDKSNITTDGSIIYYTDTLETEILKNGLWYPLIIGKNKISDGSNDVDIMSTNGSYGLVTIEPNHISTLNSTTELLGINGVFIGVAEDITNYAVMFINVYSNVDSATDGLCIQASHNGMDWHDTECYTIAANTYKTFSIQCASKYIRLKYTNGAVDQTLFHLEAKLCTKNALDSSHRIADSISDQDDATLTKSVLTAQRPNSDFINISASETGNLKITDAENSLAIAKGEVIGSSDVNKWGNAPDFDQTDGEVTVWDGAEDGEAWELMRYVYSTTADIDSISSSDATDTEEVTVIGLDSDYNEVTQTKALQGNTRVALDTPLIRVYRAYNANGTVFSGHVIVYVNTALTAGIPTDKTKIRAVIHPEEQQTEMSVYTIPAGKTGYLLGGYCSSSGSNKSSNYVIIFKVRAFNKIFRTQQKVAISDTASSFIPFTYPIPQKLEEKTDVEVTARMTATGGTGASISAGFSIILVDN